MRLSTDDEMVPSEFFDDFVQEEKLREVSILLWGELKPFAKTIFHNIQKLSKNLVPLHLLSRFPFDTSMVLDDIGEVLKDLKFVTDIDDEEQDTEALIKLKESLPRDDEIEQLELNCNKNLIVYGLRKWEFLNTNDTKELESITAGIQSLEEYEQKDQNNNANEEDINIFHQFVNYLRCVQSIFQDTRKLKNMIRDINNAIVERGVNETVFMYQIAFLFEDIRNNIESIPFFYSMRTIKVQDDQKLELWTIRNSLWVLYFLKYAVQTRIIEQHPRIYYNEQQVLDMIYKDFQDDIIDPDGETDIIFTPDDVVDNVEDQDDDDIEPQHEKNKSNEQNNMIKKSDFFDDPDEEEENKNEKEQTKEKEKDENVIEKAKSKKQRTELFLQGQITAKDVTIELKSIFKKIQERREQRVTATSTEYYRRHLNVLQYENKQLKGNARKILLLEDDESLRFVFEQFARIAKFYPNKMTKKIKVADLYSILNRKRFGSTEMIETEMIPQYVNAENIQKLYDHLVFIKQQTKNDKKKKVDVHEENKEAGDDETIDALDAFRIILLYYNIFVAVNDELRIQGDRFKVEQDVFCKFVDPDGFETVSAKWTDKTKAAAQLFQSVLDEQQQFITLGQVRTTINSLIEDIKGMKCGEFTRIKNHLQNKADDDDARCKQDREAYKDDEKYEQEELKYDEEKDHEEQKKKEWKYDENPGLLFTHIKWEEWKTFMNKLSNGFTMNTNPQTITVHSSSSSISQILGSMLNEQITRFDIIEKKKIVKRPGSEKDKDSKEYKKLRNNMKEVLNSALSFNGERITLQQLFNFCQDLCNVLRKCDDKYKIDTLLAHYDEYDNGKPTNKQKEIMNTKCATIYKKNKQKNEQDKFEWILEESFKEKIQINKRHSLSPKDKKNNVAVDNKYKLKDFEAEIKWLLNNSETVADVCHKLEPFWKESILTILNDFLESTEHIQGNYQLKAAEFAQLKHALNINGEVADKLFYLIRIKDRSLSWRQLYEYVEFLVKMKFDVERASLKAPQAEDTTISRDDLTNKLNIQYNDQAKWLFDEVDKDHGHKVSWKQIRSYLKMRNEFGKDMHLNDFFEHTRRNKNFASKQAEIMNGMRNKLEQITKSKDSMKELHEKAINKLKQRLLDNAKDGILKQETLNKIITEHFKVVVDKLRLQKFWDYCIQKQGYLRQLISTKKMNDDKLDGLKVDYFIHILELLPKNDGLEPRE
eukprot:233416_1